MDKDSHTPQTPAIIEPRQVDAHGFDLADFDWVPVLRKRRVDGWSPAKQVAFVETLADTGSVITAARAVGMSDSSCYKLRRAVGAEAFAAAWDAALEQASKRLVDVAFDRALNGVDEAVFDKEGHWIASRTRYNDRLLMFLLRAHAPDKYRHAQRDDSGIGRAAPPPCVPVAAAMQLLEPEPVAEPHKLMAPDDLDAELDIAQMMDGKLPPWRCDVGDRE